MSNIFRQISEEVQEFKTDKVTIVDNFTFKQKDTIEKIIRLYNSRFKDGDTDTEGFKKYFKNIVRNPCHSAMKAIKFTPSDIMITPAAGQDELKAWIMDRDFKFWMKENQFNKILNRLFLELPIFGTSVLKLVNGKLHFVDLRNLINEQSADSLKDSSYVIEQHYYSPHELRKQKWDNIEEVIEKWHTTDMPYIRVMERYGEVPESEFGGDPNKYVYSRYIVYIPESEMDKHRLMNIRSGGILLDKTKLKPEEFPYREFHWEKMPGRWMGVGRVELLTDPQVRTNEIVNLRVKSSYVAGLNIWQTRDDNIKKNLIKDIANGQVLTTMDRIEKVPTEDRNLTPFVQEEGSWLNNRDEVGFTYDTFRGERSPAGTPLGAMQMSVQMMASYFEHIREAIAADMKKMIYEDIVPLFKDSDEHYIRLVGEDLDKWNQLKIKQKTSLEILHHTFKHGQLPTPVQVDVIKQITEQKVREGKNSALIPKDFYKNLKYAIDIVITGQDKDMRVQAANMAMALQTMIADPTVLTDPAKRKVFGKQLEAVGINIADITPEEMAPSEQPIQQRAERQGGGISGPSLPQNMQPEM